MKITIERASLLRSLAHVQSVVERRTTIPILANVLLDAKDGQLGLTATDMDITIAEKVDAEISQSGTMTAPALTLCDIVRKLPEGAQVELDSEGNAERLTLRSGRSTFTLACLPAGDFPAMTEDDQPHNFSLSAADLRGLVDHTRFAISTEETRYYLNGIYLHAADEDGVAMLRAVATDGHRLARFQVPLPTGAAGIPGVLVPRTTAQAPRTLTDAPAGHVAGCLAASRARLRLRGLGLTP